MKEFKITVCGLGYVGLPLLKRLSFYFDVNGFDISKRKINQIKRGEIDYENCNFIKKNKVIISQDLKELRLANVYIICVPTPIDNKNIPDLSLLKNLLLELKKYIKKKDIIIFESTYYPGVTNEYAKKFLSTNKLKFEKDFFVGYSPERINPGDKKHTLENTTKLISANNQNILKDIEYIYSQVVNKTHICSSIEIAEMSKIIENVQRDINIGFINEILIICNNLNIPFLDVHKAAKTKWNFLDFYPGLVGGHCISVDTYYLKYLTRQKNIKTNIINSGRKINEHMTLFFKKKIDSYFKYKKISILFLGYSFKENVSDIRNSKNLEMIKLFETDKKYNVAKFDPLVERQNISDYFNNDKKKYDCIYILSPHDQFKSFGFKSLSKKLKVKGFIFDPKNLFDEDSSNILRKI